MAGLLYVVSSQRLLPPQTRFLAQLASRGRSGGTCRAIADGGLLRVTRYDTLQSEALLELLRGGEVVVTAPSTSSEVMHNGRASLVEGGTLLILELCRKRFALWAHMCSAPKQRFVQVSGHALLEVQGRQLLC